jgi:capsular polysaccharide biosynthesis protein
VFVNKEQRLPGSEPRGLQRIRTELVKRVGCEAGAKRNGVYLWRRNSGTRMLQNAKEVETALRGWVAREFLGRLSVEMYDPATLSLRESALRMCKCALVVHMHGGLLYHAIALPDESAVVELLPRQGMCTTGSHFNVALRHQWWGLGVAGHRDQRWSNAAVSELNAVLAEVGAYLSKKSWI